MRDFVKQSPLPYENKQTTVDAFFMLWHLLDLYSKSCRQPEAKSIDYTISNIPVSRSRKEVPHYSVSGTSCESRVMSTF